MDYSKLSKKQLIELVKKLESQQNNTPFPAKGKVLSTSVTNVIQTNKAQGNEQKIIQNLRRLVTQLQLENKKLTEEKDELSEDAKELRIIVNNIKVVGQNILIALKEFGQAAYKTLTERYDLNSIKDLSNGIELEKLLLQLLIDQWNAYADILKYKNYTLNNSSEKSSTPARTIDQNSTNTDSSNSQAQESVNDEVEGEFDPLTIDDVQDESQKELEKENSESFAKTGKQKYSTVELSNLPNVSNLSKEEPLPIINKIASGIKKNLNERDHQKEHLVLTDKKISTPNNDQGTIAGVISLNKDDIIYNYCPTCGKITRCKISTIKRDNVVSVLDNSKIKNILAPVYAITCQECKDTFDYNPTEFERISYITDLRSNVFNILRNNEVKDKCEKESQAESHIENHTEKSNLNLGSTHCKTKEKANFNSNVSNDADSGLSRNSDISERRTIVARAQVISAETELKIREFEKKITELDALLSKGNLDPKQSASIQAKIQYYDNKIRRLLADFLSSLPDAYERIGSISDSLVTTKDGNTIIDPYKFDSDLWGRMPLFLKSRISVGLAASMGAFLTNLFLPKSRISVFLNQLGSNYSRTQTITFINNFARAYIRPISRLIRNDILANCSSVLMDETPIKSKFKKTKNGNLGNYTMWTLVSSRTSPIKAAWFTCTSSRSKDTVVNLFKDAPESLKTLTVDMFCGYPAALKELEDAYGVKITLTSCLTHLRRPLHRYLSDNCLIKIYQDLITEAENFANFNKALTERCKTHKDLSENDIILLSIYYFINCVYAIDSEVVLRHSFNVQTEAFKADLLQERQNSSTLVIDAIYKLAKMFVAKNPHLFNIKQNNDTKELKFFGTTQRREAKAIAFLLNNETQMRVFLTNPEVETNESACERSLRTGVLAKNSFNFIASPDGMEAFSDYQTIEATCRLNNVSTTSYLIWLATNIRFRLIKQKNQGKDDPTMFVMPCDVKLKEPDPLKEGCKMYHSKNLMCYDKVDVKGLTPYDYARYLRELKPNEKLAGEGHL